MDLYGVYYILGELRGGRGLMLKTESDEDLFIYDMKCASVDRKRCMANSQKR